jgi:hypothetical protein
MRFTAMKKHIGLFLVVVILVSIITSALLLRYTSSTKENANSDTPEVYVGVDLAYANLPAIENQIDQMSSYTNLIVIGSTGITYTSQLNNVCQYICDKGLYFILYTENAPPLQWLQNAINKWGNHFLGLYAYDEPGGKQVDRYKDQMAVRQATNYTDAANQYNNLINLALGDIKRNYDNSTNVPLFSSDYALYWFDYKAGYDTIFAEFGWNYSRQLNVALVRGAATVQNKDWGVMITWTYTSPPYIESGPQLLDDMKLAYDNGAKYIIVFDSNANYTQGILQPEHLQAMQQFWQYVQANPRPSDPPSSRVAFVLPNDYAYGFRGPNDKIWGLWQADNFTEQLCVNLNNVLQQYGSKLDIIYDDPTFPNYTSVYGTLIFWNGTVIGG